MIHRRWIMLHCHIGWRLQHACGIAYCRQDACIQMLMLVVSQCLVLSITTIQTPQKLLLGIAGRERQELRKERNEVHVGCLSNKLMP